MGATPGKSDDNVDVRIKAFEESTISFTSFLVAQPVWTNRTAVIIKIKAHTVFVFLNIGSLHLLSIITLLIPGHIAFSYGQ